MDALGKGAGSRAGQERTRQACRGTVVKADCLPRNPNTAGLDPRDTEYGSCSPETKLPPTPDVKKISAVRRKPAVLSSGTPR